MIEHVDDLVAHGALDCIKILDHAARGPLAFDRASYRNLETIGMAVHTGTLALVVREHVSRLEAEGLSYLHGTGVAFAERSRVALRINREELVIAAVVGEVAPMVVNAGLYDVGFEGEPQILPATGGITPNVRVGDSAFGFRADHIEPAVTIRNPDDRANTALNTLACIGNEAVVTSGDAKGARGRVTGKHGGVEHVMVDFSPDVMRSMAIGDRVQVWSCGLGMLIIDAPAVKVFNADPDLLDACGAEAHEGRLSIAVSRIVPAAVMGSGLGRSTVVRGDYDVQTFDDELARAHGLREIRLGDIIAIKDADNSFGRIYRTGALTVGVVVHGRSFIAGHGPGVTTLLTSPAGNIDVSVDERANLATILKLR